MIRSVLAIVTGFFMIAVLSLSTDAVVRTLVPGAYDATGRVDSVPLLLFTMFYVGVFAVAGCYLAARMAPSRPMLHALVLGGLGLAFNIAGSIQLWHTAPAWYHTVSLALVLPFAWIGGRLREHEVQRVIARKLAGAAG